MSAPATLQMKLRWYRDAVRMRLFQPDSLAACDGGGIAEPVLKV